MREWFVRGDTIISYSGISECVIVPAVINGHAIRKIGNNAFSPNNKSVKEETRESRRRIISVEIEEGIESIGSSSFAGCTALKRISIPNSCKMIGGNAFVNCKSLEELYISLGTRIGSYAFKGCTALKRFIFPYDPEKSYSENGGTLSTPFYGFESCESLELVVLSPNIHTVSEGSFSGCKSLKRIDIPADCQIIGNFAFEGCSELEEISVPDSIGLGNAAFSGCSSLKRFNSPIIRFPPYDSWRLISTPERLFWNCNSLEEASLSPNLQRVSERTFANCSSLKSISIPEKLLYIDENAYFNW